MSIGITFILVNFFYCRSLRTQISCGEVLPASVAREFVKKLPQCTLANTYGPTEATIHVTSHIVTENSFGSSIPIGRPLSNVVILILDKYHQPMPIGIPGELFIGGACLAMVMN